MERTSADYVIEKLKQINFPIRNTIMSEDQLNEVKKQIDEIQESLNFYKKTLDQVKRIG